MKRFVFILFYLVCSTVSASELVVIAHPSADVSQLDKNQLISIYMGRTTTLNNGNKVLPLDQNPNSPLKNLFYKWLIDKDVKEVNAYWARLVFTGKATPPYTVENSNEVVEVVSQNPSAIGYIDKNSLSDQVKVIEYAQ